MTALSSLHARRRAHLASQLGEGGIAIVPTAPEHLRNRDTDYLYRHDSYFYYLTGFTEPQAWLVLTAEGRSTLFCQPKDLEREIWDGYRLGPDAAVEALGVDAAHSTAQLELLLPRLLENRERVWFPFATHEGLAARVDGWLQKVRARVRFGALCPAQQGDLCTLLDEMRLVKDAHEQGRDAPGRPHQRRRPHPCHAVQRAHAARRRGRARIPPRRRAAARVPPPRLAGGGVQLHRRCRCQCLRAALPRRCCARARGRAGADRRRLRAGRLCQRHHAHLPGRRPLHGPQRDVYDLVLASQHAAVAATKAGARFNDPHEATVAVLSQGLLDLGLLDKSKYGSAQDVIEQRAYFPFYMHRTGHWLGMDVHDCGSYVEPSEVGDTSERKDPLSGETITNRPSRILRPGMVLTIEPGLYIRPAPGVPEAFHHIGIRIEDDAIVTDSGCELITRDVPVEADEIEALMRA